MSGLSQTLASKLFHLISPDNYIFLINDVSVLLNIGRGNCRRSREFTRQNFLICFHQFGLIFSEAVIRSIQKIRWVQLLRPITLKPDPLGQNLGWRMSLLFLAYYRYAMGILTLQSSLRELGQARLRAWLRIGVFMRHSRITVVISVLSIGYFLDLMLVTAAKSLKPFLLSHGA